MTTRAAILGLSLVISGLPGVSAAQDDKVQVQFDRTGYRLTALGAKDTVAARVVDARRRPVPNKPIAYRTSDPSVAVVTQQGVVQSRRVGRTRIWAVSGKDSASALIVVDQWAKTFAFTPPAVSFDAIGTQQPFRVQLRDAVGNAIPDAGRRTVQCRVREDAIASLSAAGQVQSKANGLTWIRCTDRGIADSVRVEVRQRPARATIVDKLQIGTKTIPDTFTLRVRAQDRRDSLIVGARPTWVSLAPNFLTINPVTGFVRTIGPGTARIVAQVGDATDTVTVTVVGTAIAGGTATDGAPSTTPGDSAREPTLQLNQISPFVGDTVKVTMTAQDAAGAPIQNPERSVALRSSDTAVVVVLSNQRLHIKSSGSAYVHARFSDAGTTITDSMLVIPRTRVGSSSTAASAASAANTAAFVRPSRDTAGARIRNARQIDSVLTSIRESGIGRTTSGRTVAFEVVAAQAKHYTRLTATSVEERSGLMFGGGATVTPFRRVALSGAVRRGTLLSASAASEDLNVTEVDAQLAVWPTTYFGIGLGYMIRGESTDLSLEQWNAMNITAMFRGTFVGNNISTFASASFFPISGFTGSPDVAPEKSSLGAEAGLDLRFGVLAAGFRYYLERFSFPASLGDQREDQFSTLRFRLGLKFGK